MTLSSVAIWVSLSRWLLSLVLRVLALAAMMLPRRGSMMSVASRSHLALIATSHGRKRWRGREDIGTVVVRVRRWGKEGHAHRSTSHHRWMMIRSQRSHVVRHGWHLIGTHLVVSIVWHMLVHAWHGMQSRHTRLLKRTRHARHVRHGRGQRGWAAITTAAELRRSVKGSAAIFIINRLLGGRVLVVSHHLGNPSVIHGVTGVECAFKPMPMAGELRVTSNSFALDGDLSLGSRILVRRGVSLTDVTLRVGASMRGMRGASGRKLVRRGQLGILLLFSRAKDIPHMSASRSIGPQGAIGGRGVSGPRGSSKSEPTTCSR